MSSVLVMGGSYFVGPAVVEALRHRYEVSVLNRGSRPLGIPGVRELVADRRDRRAVADALTDRYDIVVDLSGYEPDEVAPALERVSATCGRYVYLSSGAVYDRSKSDPPFAETAAGGGDAVWGDYGELKQACEDLLTDALGDRVVHVRPPYLYGPGNYLDREPFVWTRIVEDQPIFVPGDGTTKIQFCHVDDLAKTIAHLVDDRSLSGPVNVGEPGDHTFREFLELAGEAAGRAPRVVEVGDADVAARSYFPFRNVAFSLDVQRAGAAIPVSHRPLGEGLRSSFPEWLATGPRMSDPTEQEAQWRALPPIQQP